MEPLGRNGHSPDAGGVRGAGTSIMRPGLRGASQQGDLFSLAPCGSAGATDRHKSRQGLLPGERPDEGRSHSLLRRRRRLHSSARPRPPHANAALPRRRGRVLLLPEARSESASRLARDGAHPPGRTADFPVVTEAAGLADRQPRLHRPAHLALPGGRHRAAGLHAHRPRSERGNPGRTCARSRSSSRR